VRLTLPGNDGLRRVGKNSLAEAIRGSSTTGAQTWNNVQRRDCALPVPETTKYALEQSSQQADVFVASDVPLAIHKLLGAKEALVWFLDQDFIAAVRALVARCGSSDFSKLEGMISAVEAVLRDREAQMAAFQVPALREDAATASMRLHKTEEGRVLLSVHDELKWLGLDDDGKHNEWTHWLCASLGDCLEKGIHSSSDPRNCEYPCLEYIKLPGERNPTPMGDVMCFRQVIFLCIGKSRLAGELAQKALEVYARHVVGDRRLDAERAANAASAPREARAFVLGPEEAARQEGFQKQIVAAFQNELVQTSMRQQFVEAFQGKLVQTTIMQHFVTAFQRELVQSEKRVIFGLSQRLLDIKNFMKDVVMSPTGVFLDAVRRAVKKPALKTSVDTERFPEAQRATSQQLHQDCLDLRSAVHKELQLAPPGVLPWVQKGPGCKSYRVWKSMRGLLGKRVLALRKADGELPPTDLDHCPLPLLWANCSAKSTTNTGEAAGQRYVYLEEELKRYIPMVLAGKRKVQLTTDGYVATCYNLSQPRRPRFRQEMTLRDLLERLQKEELQQGFEPLQWPVSDLDGNVSVEEMLGSDEDDDS
jgi:hypothetical protein